MMIRLSFMSSFPGTPAASANCVARGSTKAAGFAGNKKPHRLTAVGSEILVCESEPDCRATKQQRASKQSESVVPNHGAKPIEVVGTGQRHFSLKPEAGGTRNTQNTGKGKSWGSAFFAGAVRSAVTFLWNFGTSPISLCAMPEKPLNAIPRPQRELYEKGVAAIQRNNLDYAISILAGVLKIEPGFFDARQALRAAQVKRAGGPTASTGFFKKMIGGATSQPALAKVQLLLRRNPIEAIEAAEEILNGDWQNTGAHKLLAEAALASGLLKTAVLSLEILCKANPRDRELAMQLGDAYTQADQNDKAEAVYSELLRQRPNDPEVLQLLKNVTARQTLDEGGYEEVAESGGSYRDILRNKDEAVQLEQANRIVKSEDVAGNLIAEYEARLQREPGNLKLMRNIAELHVQKKDFDRALEYFESIRGTEGGADPSLEKAIADTTLKKLDHAKAQLDPAAADYDQHLAEIEAQRSVFQLEACRARAEKYPTDLQIRFELGQLYFQTGKISEAIQEFQKAQNNPQRRLAAIMYLGRCFAHRGMNDMAARKFQDALKEKPGFDDEKKELLYELGCVLEKMGKPDEAIEQFKQIYEADIGYRDVAAKVDAYYAARG
jgi:tetratricopeptide (TPR) repeat protein